MFPGEPVLGPAPSAWGSRADAVPALGSGHYSSAVEMLDFAAVSHRGAVKPVNEDSVLAQAPVFVVADGISGCERGELASGLVTEFLTSLADDPELTPDQVADALSEAQERVLESQQRDHHRAATTVCGAVGLRMDGLAYWILFNVGDSRLYRVTGRNREIQLVSVDHSHVQELMDAGVITPEQAARHPERHVITRALGTDRFDPDFWLVPMVAGERLLICSDGLLGETDFADVARITCARNDPADAVDELLTLALEAGARDNVSIIVVDIPAESADVDETRPGGPPAVGD